jgi:cation diffusion facilitator family transporter
MPEHLHPHYGRGREERTNEATRVTIVGAVVNLFLVAGKLAAGIAGSSQALVADAVHSLSDLATDVFLLFTVKIAGKEADEEHPYGHGRAETMGSMVMGGSLILVGVFIVYEVIVKMTGGGELAIPTWPAFLGAAVSIVVKEVLFQYTFRVGKRINNQSVIANAWEHRSDSLSAIAALIGITGAMMGFPVMDPLAAIVVVFMIEKVGWDIFWEAVKDLMDTSLPKEQMQEIINVISGTRGVARFHELRTRRLGADIFVDAHIIVQPNISISEAHNTAETVRSNLRKKAGVVDALVHIDAEDDVYYQIMDVNRGEIEKKVRDAAMEIDGVRDASEVIIHMLNGKVCVDFSVEIDDSLTIGRAKELVKRLQQRLVADGAMDMVVIHARLTAGALENEFYPGAANKEGA